MTTRSAGRGSRNQSIARAIQNAAPIAAPIAARPSINTYNRTAERSRATLRRIGRGGSKGRAAEDMRWAVGGGQWAVGSGQWAVGSGQWAVDVEPTTVIV